MADSVTFETIRTFFQHKQLVWDVSRDNLKKGYEGYEGYGLPPYDSPLWRVVASVPPSDWTPDALRARHKERAAALLAELDALPRLTTEQALERRYYRRTWCGGGQ